MIDYIFRNQGTSGEMKIRSKRKIAIKRFDETFYRFENNIPEGYGLNQVVDYRTSARERKAK